jgi:hypothetical protein
MTGKCPASPALWAGSFTMYGASPRIKKNPRRAREKKVHLGETG